MKHVMRFMAGLLNAAFEKVKDGNGLFLRESRGSAVLFTAMYKPLHIPRSWHTVSASGTVNELMNLTWIWLDLLIMSQKGLFLL